MLTERTIRREAANLRKLVCAWCDDADPNARNMAYAAEQALRWVLAEPPTMCPTTAAHYDRRSTWRPHTAKSTRGEP